MSVMHNRYIGSIYRPKRQQQGHCPILGMSVNGASTIFRFTSWVFYVPIGWRHPFFRHWQPLLGRLQRHAPCHILRMSVNRASTMVSFASWVIYVLIGSRHPFIRYWQPVLGKTTATCSLLHSENERKPSVNDL